MIGSSADPINKCLAVAQGKAPSILTDLTRGSVERFTCLMAGGYLCGFLWEVWNFWSASKWVYSAPFTPHLKYFEMPLAGFLGFGPFALEYFVMYAFARMLVRRGEAEPSEAIAW